MVTISDNGKTAYFNLSRNEPLISINFEMSSTDNDQLSRNTVVFNLIDRINQLGISI